MERLKPDFSPDWKPTNVAASDLAAQVGKAMAALRDTKATIYVDVETPMGRGYMNQTAKIQDNKHYKIEYAILGDRPKLSFVVANGKEKQEQIDGKWEPAVALSKTLPDANAPESQMAEKWALDFTRSIWTGFTDSRDSWTPVIAQWQQGTGGYQVTTQERHLNYQGHDLVDYRIQAERTPEAAAKLGKSTVQIVIDATRHLPVTIISNNTDASGKNWKMMWTSKYDFGKKFGPKDFS